MRAKGRMEPMDVRMPRAVGVTPNYGKVPKQLAPGNWELANQVDTEILIEKEQTIQELRETVEVFILYIYIIN